MTMVRHALLLALATTLVACDAREAPDTDDAPAADAPAQPATTTDTAPALPAGHPPLDAPAPSAASAPDTSDLPTPGQRMSVAGVSWMVPETWRPQKPSSSMRAAQFMLMSPDPAAAEGAILAVFPAIGGSVQDNIDRWIAQIGDPIEGPITETMDVAGLHITHVSVTGTYTPMMMSGSGGAPRPETTLLGAVIEGGPSGNVFLKATGARHIVEHHRQEWLDMLASVEPAG